MKFKYRNEILPKVVWREEGYERIKTVVPLGLREVAVVFITSQGEYTIINIVTEDEIIIVN